MANKRNLSLPMTKIGTTVNVVCQIILATAILPLFPSVLESAQVPPRPAAIEWEASKLAAVCDCVHPGGYAHGCRSVVGQREETKPRKECEKELVYFEFIGKDIDEPLVTNHAKCTHGVGNPVWGQLEPQHLPQTHRFFDRNNLIGFSAMFVGRSIDLHSTCRGLKKGTLKEELFPSQDCKTIVIGAYSLTAGAVGISYWLHRKGHHKLERWLPRINAISGGVAATWNYSIQ